MIIKLNNFFTVILILIVSITVISCFSYTGTFAFKTSGDDRFIIKDNLCEFNKNDIVDWTFCFNNIRNKQKIGAIILKKEKVWVDVFSFYETLNRDKPCIYGHIEDYDEGLYKIVITFKDNVIAEKEFLIFKEEFE
ncbi:MAG TPA: hypothetical protein P5130_06325 [Spirochaetota bacterium]|nr:hypothetical protein [Spirochaetota bacterium]HRV14881.1 hypothetical protein [Spirochaetota bacterium]